MLRPGPSTWKCSDCISAERLWRQRGCCDGAPTRAAGAEHGEIDAEVCVSASAGLGRFRSCPVALVRRHQAEVDRIFGEYSILRRYGCRADNSIDWSLLMALDNEVRTIERLEREDERKRAELQRRLAHGKGR